jgi:hypothetical protein
MLLLARRIYLFLKNNVILAVASKCLGMIVLRSDSAFGCGPGSAFLSHLDPDPLFARSRVAPSISFCLRDPNKGCWMLLYFENCPEAS